MSTPLLKSSEANGNAIEAPWGRLTWLANGDIGNVNDLTLGFVVIRKGKQNSRHSHPNCEEVLYLLKGRLEHCIGDESVVMEPGDTIAMPPGEINVPALFEYMNQKGFTGRYVVEMEVKDSENTLNYLEDALDYRETHCTGAKR